MNMGAKIVKLVTRLFFSKKKSHIKNLCCLARNTKKHIVGGFNPFEQFESSWCFQPKSG